VRIQGQKSTSCALVYYAQPHIFFVVRTFFFNSFALPNANVRESCDCFQDVVVQTADRLPASVFYAIKTTSKTKYFLKSLEILESWSIWCQDRIAFFTDTDFPEHNKKLKSLIGAANVVDDQACHMAEYHGQQMIFAQHAKQQNMLDYFVGAKNGWPARMEKWACYIDDDMYVHVPRIERELHALEGLWRLVHRG
jgi:hypothetical protein